MTDHERLTIVKTRRCVINSWFLFLLFHLPNNEAFTVKSINSRHCVSFASSLQNRKSFKRPFHQLNYTFGTKSATCLNTTPKSSNNAEALFESKEFDFLKILEEGEVMKTKEDLLTKDQIELIYNLVKKRSDARYKGNYEEADAIRHEIHNISSCQSFLPDGFMIEIRDIPRIEGGGSHWDLQWVQSSYGKDKDDDGSVLQLAHAALGLAISASERGTPLNRSKLEELVRKAKIRLLKTGITDLRGRKAADAAFWFALAGVTDREVTLSSDVNSLRFSLFDALTIISIIELRRFGKKSTCRALDIMHIMERIFAAGITGNFANRLQKLAVECLEVKDIDSVSHLELKKNMSLFRDGKFGLHSDRPLLWIWRFSTRQRKQRAFLQSAALHWERHDISQSKFDKNEDRVRGVLNKKDYIWGNIFKNTTLPLVIDLGCGMGVSLLGLSTLYENSVHESNMSNNINWSECNFIGADLSEVGINYASSVATRWDLNGKLHFSTDSAENVLNKIIRTYSGPVQLIMIQFPTPFRFHPEQNYNAHDISFAKNNIIDNKGNSQLPIDSSSGFMVTTELLERAYLALKSSCGMLLLQSNCEDVAVQMKNIARQAGFASVEVHDSVDEVQLKKQKVTRRTEKWICLGGERAVGKEWSSEPLIPRKGATETEVSCLLNETPVHRCLMLP